MQSVKPRGIVSVPRGERILRPVDDSLFSRKHCFQLILADETLYLNVDEEQQKRDWTAALRSLTMDDAKAAEPASGRRLMRSLEVHVLEAKQIKRSGGEAFVLVYLDGEAQARSQTRGVLPSPIWNDHFILSYVYSAVVVPCGVAMCHTACALISVVSAMQRSAGERRDADHCAVRHEGSIGS